MGALQGIFVILLIFNPSNLELGDWPKAIRPRINRAL
jgi:hypothetical protein